MSDRRKYFGPRYERPFHYEMDFGPFLFFAGLFAGFIGATLRQILK